MNLSCIKSSPYNTSEGAYLIASGGKENDLKVWDLNQSSENKEPIFRGKNVPDNWMQLREPIWIKDINFLDASRIVTSTAYHQVMNFLLCFFINVLVKEIFKNKIHDSYEVSVLNINP